MTDEAYSPPIEAFPQGETFGGDSTGIANAAQELLRKRGITADEPAGPGDMSDERNGVEDDEAISAADGKKALLSFREARARARAEFNAAVTGEPIEPSAEDSAAHIEQPGALEGHLGDQANPEPATTPEPVQQHQEPALNHVAEQVRQHVDNAVMQTYEAALHDIVSRLPEAAGLFTGDRSALDAMRHHDPERFRESASSPRQGHLVGRIQATQYSQRDADMRRGAELQALAEQVGEMPRTPSGRLRP